MRIVLFELFGIQIKSYGLMIAIGIIVAASIKVKREDMMKIRYLI